MKFTLDGIRVEYNVSSQMAIIDKVPMQVPKGMEDIVFHLIQKKVQGKEISTLGALADAYLVFLERPLPTTFNMEESHCSLRPTKISPRVVYYSQPFTFKTKGAKKLAIQVGPYKIFTIASGSWKVEGNSHYDIYRFDLAECMWLVYNWGLLEMKATDIDSVLNHSLRWMKFVNNKFLDLGIQLKPSKEAYDRISHWKV